MTPTRWTGDIAPRAKARLGGALFLATIIVGITAQEALGGRLIVAGDAVQLESDVA